jgi:hypothetical protein
LISTLGLLLAVLTLTTRPSNNADASAFERPDPEPVRHIPVAKLPDTHLVVLVDPPGVVHGLSLSREIEAGIEHVVSVEVVEATESVLRGLEEAITVAAASPCHSTCIRLSVLDIRAKPAP